MAHINLLPWREELAKQKKQEFAFSAGGGIVVAALVVLMAHLHVDGLINNQNQRNPIHSCSTKASAVINRSTTRV